MKKATISLIIFLMSLSGVFGQAFKIIGGISRARFTELPGWGTIPEVSFVSDYKPGSVFGIGVEFPLDRYLSFDVCGLYFQKGMKITWFYWEEEMGLSKYGLNVISLPACLKVRFLRDSSPYILAGGELSYVLSHRLTDDFAGQRSSADLKDKTRSFDFGLVVGGGVEATYRRWAVFFEFRYHAGLTNLSKGIQVYPLVNTRALAFLLGFKLRPAKQI